MRAADCSNAPKRLPEPPQKNTIPANVGRYLDDTPEITGDGA
ncbi:hypothetical protein JJ691_57830 [Kutzneria sp. CA-103260]|nr:hypothetical protein JJ691_57830 [Kutzneria sp. CA-103260]